MLALLLQPNFVSLLDLRYCRVGARGHFVVGNGVRAHGWHLLGLHNTHR